MPQQLFESHSRIGPGAYAALTPAPRTPKPFMRGVCPYKPVLPGGAEVQAIAALMTLRHTLAVNSAWSILRDPLSPPLHVRATQTSWLLNMLQQW